jgi:hypothetical protein
VYEALLAAEPHATAERRRDLRLQATRQARQSPLFFDLTISLSKSISIFHASLGENARLARQAGDTDGDRYWTALVGEVDEMIWQAVHAGFGYFQREAGYTRTGSHNTRVHGQDPAQVLAAAIAERDLAGARDIPAVIDARLRHRLGSVPPLPPQPWSAQVPAIADPERRAYVTQIAALMDARKDRIAEHAADQPLPWAVNSLGPVPADTAGRRAWQQRASSIGAYRELSGYDSPADPIGPEPATAAPETRAAWHEAAAALGPVDGPDVRTMPDANLLHLRDTYPLETAWAPRYVGDELRQVRAAAWAARLAGLRATVEAAAARHRGDYGTAVTKDEFAASYQALHDAYKQRENVFAATMADREDWDLATRAQRQLAIAADAELRRRHPD